MRDGTDRAKGAAVDTLSATNTFLIMDHGDARVRVDLQSIYRAGLAAGPHQIRNGIIRTGRSTHTTLTTLRRVDIGLMHADGDGAEFTGIIAGFSHTVLTVVCYRIAGNGTFLAGRGDDINRIRPVRQIRCSAQGSFALCQIHSLSDNLPLLVDTAAKLRFRSSDHVIRNAILFFLEFTLKGQLRYAVKNFMLNL